MGKSKTKVPTLEEQLARPWCYYCERTFDDLVVLVQHQKAVHFKCQASGCGRRLYTIGGLNVHMNHVHKETLDKVPNALPGRENPQDSEIYGMEGVPKDVRAAHEQRITNEYWRVANEYRARTGNPLAGSVAAAPAPKDDSKDLLTSLRERKAAHKAAKAAQKAAAAAGSGITSELGNEDAYSGSEPATPANIHNAFAPPKHTDTPPAVSMPQLESGFQHVQAGPGFPPMTHQAGHGFPPPAPQEGFGFPYQNSPPGYGNPSPQPMMPYGGPPFHPHGPVPQPPGPAFQPFPSFAPPPGQFGGGFGVPPPNHGPPQQPPQHRVDPAFPPFHPTGGSRQPPFGGMPAGHHGQDLAPQRSTSALASVPGLPQRPNFNIPNASHGELQAMHNGSYYTGDPTTHENIERRDWPRQNENRQDPEISKSNEAILQRQNEILDEQERRSLSDSIDELINSGRAAAEAAHLERTTVVAAAPAALNPASAAQPANTRNTNDAEQNTASQTANVQDNTGQNKLKRKAESTLKNSETLSQEELLASLPKYVYDAAQNEEQKSKRPRLSG